MIIEITKNGFKWHCIEFEFGKIVEVVANSSEVLRVATINFETVNNRTLTKKDAFNELLFGLLSSLKLNVEFYKPNEHEGGRMQSDGNFNGLVGMLQSNASDLAIAPMVLTPERFQAVSLAGTLDCSNLLSLLALHKTRPADISTFFQCFTTECWIAWLLTFLAFRLVFRGLKCIPGYLGHFRVDSFLIVFVVAWGFLAFFFEIVFTNDMLANLTTPTMFAIDTLDELLNDKSVSVLVDPRGYLYQTLLKNLPFYNPVKFISNPKEVIKTMLGDNLVYVRSESAVNLVMKNYPFLPLHKGESKYLSVCGLFVSKYLSADLKAKIALKFSYFKESGFPLFWIEKTYFSINYDELDFNDDTITLYDLRIAFILQTSSVLMAVIVFLFEILHALLLLFVALRDKSLYFK